MTSCQQWESILTLACRMTQMHTIQVVVHHVAKDHLVTELRNNGKFVLTTLPVGRVSDIDAMQDKIRTLYRELI